MPDNERDLDLPFSDSIVRKSWLDVVEYLEDDEVKTLTYRAWLEVAKDEAFIALSEDLNEIISTVAAFERYSEFMEWFGRLQTEQAYLNRRDHARGVVR